MKPLVIALMPALLLACRERPESRTAHLQSGSVDALQRRQAQRLFRFDSAGNRGAALVQGITVAAATPVRSTFVPTEVAPNMVIRTATASVEVDSLEPAIAQIKQLAARLGGYVANSDIEVGNHRQRQGDIEVKVPAERFEEALSGLTPIGRLESVNVEAQDVGEEFVDITARMDNAKRLERRLIELLSTRTGKLKDVLAVEEALARVREEIERHEGRIRYLKAHTAMSTLTVTVHEPFPVVGTAGKSVMGEALAGAWRNFVVLMAFAVQSLGVILPLGVLAIVGWMLTKRFRLARQRTA